MMKRKLRLLKKVQGVRKRLRDLAAGAAQQADVKWYAAKDELARAEGEMEALLDDGPGRLTAASSVDELDQFDAERVWRRRGVSEADLARAVAEADSQRLRVVLRGKERDLRVADRLVDRVREALDKYIDRQEQKAADDLSGTRSTRRSE